MEGLSVNRGHSFGRSFRAVPPYRLGTFLSLSGLIVFVAASSLGTEGCQYIGPGASVTNVGGWTAGSRLRDVCLVCHNGQNAPDVTGFLTGPHKNQACEGCHGSGYLHVRNGGRGGLFIDDLNGLMTVASRLLCKRCHGTEVTGFEKSDHATEKVLSCPGCHDVHAGARGAPSAVNNNMCLRCHRARGFGNDEAIEAHTHHPVDPDGTSASRCTKCHLVPLEGSGSGIENVPHEHSLLTVAPLRSIEAIDAGVVPVPANSCAGIAGCHDGSVSTAPVFDVDNRATDLLLQALFEEWYGSP